MAKKTTITKTEDSPTAQLSESETLDDGVGAENAELAANIEQPSVDTAVPPSTEDAPALQDVPPPADGAALPSARDTTHDPSTDPAPESQPEPEPMHIPDWQTADYKGSLTGAQAQWRKQNGLIKSGKYQS